MARRLKWPDYPYYWRVKRRRPDLFRVPCRVLVRGGMNSALIETVEGERIVTSRNYLRRR